MGNRGRLITNLAVATACLLVTSLFLDRHNLWWFVACFLYGTAFEYTYHRWFLHLFRGSVWKKHVIHHRKYVGEGFRTRDSEDVHISEDWYFFPIAFVAHVIWLDDLWAAAGLVAYYCLFEITHWTIHVDGNMTEGFVRSVPGVRWMWDKTLEHHREHHERPSGNFAFVWPFPWDAAFGTGHKRLSHFTKE